MRLKRTICMIFICILIAGTFCVPASAVEKENTAPVSYAVTPRATEQLDVTVPAKTTVLISSSFSLSVGEKVTIQAYYSPASASVDFGLVDSDGTYHYFNETDGNVNKTIQVAESGSYTLQIRNNSSNKVEVSGFVKY